MIISLREDALPRADCELPLGREDWPEVERLVPPKLAKAVLKGIPQSEWGTWQPADRGSRAQKARSQPCSL